MKFLLLMVAFLLLNLALGINGIISGNTEVSVWLAAFNFFTTGALAACVMLGFIARKH